MMTSSHIADIRVRDKASDSILIELNQSGTLSETVETIAFARGGAGTKPQ